MKLRCDNRRLAVVHVDLASCTNRLTFSVAFRTLDRFRVNEQGFQNRYRSRANAYPHPDLAYSVLYPATDNPDYTLEDNRNNRRENVQKDKYDIRRKVNGSFDLKVYTDTVLPAAVI